MGVIYGNRAPTLQRNVNEIIIWRVVQIGRGKYQGFNNHHLIDELKEEQHLELSREKVRGTFAPLESQVQESAAPQSTEAAEKDDCLRK
jgi:hypothetical protein